MFEARAGVKLRDARNNLLAEVLDCVTALHTEIDREELEILHALLERRIFNFLQRGNNEAYTPNAIQFIDVAEIEDLTLMVGVVRSTLVPSAELWCRRRCLLSCLS